MDEVRGLDQDARYYVVWRVEMGEYMDQIASAFYSQPNAEEQAYNGHGQVEVGLEAISARQEKDGRWLALFTSKDELRKWYRGPRTVRVPLSSILDHALREPVFWKGIVIDPLGSSVLYSNELLRAAANGEGRDAGEARRVKFRSAPLPERRPQVLETPGAGEQFGEDLRAAAFLTDAEESGKEKLAAAVRHVGRDGQVLMAYRFEMDDLEAVVRRIAEAGFLGGMQVDPPTARMYLCQIPDETDGSPQVIVFTEPAQLPLGIRQEDPDARYVPVPFEAMCWYVMDQDVRLVVNPFNVDTLSRRPRSLRADGRLVLDAQTARAVLEEAGRPACRGQGNARLAEREKNGAKAE